MCYDHIAGRLGVAIAHHLLTEGAVVFDSDSGKITAQAPPLLQEIGLDYQVHLVTSKRVLCRPCLDWSERRYHIAGQLGSILCHHFTSENWLRRSKETRVLQITPKGELEFKNWLGREAWLRVVSD